MVEALVIGLDGASSVLIDRWIQSGDLPHFGDLSNRGIFGNLRSVFPPVTVPAWYSFATGMNPGKFGVLDRSQVNETGGKTRFSDFDEELADAADVNMPFLWNWLGSREKKASAIGVPSMYPAYGNENTRVVSGPTIGGSQWAHPESFKQKIKEITDEYVTVGTPNLNSEDSNEVKSQLQHHSSQVHRVALEELDRDELDFLQVVYMSTDWAGHYFWEQENEEHRKESSETEIDSLKEHYIWIDDKVGELVEKAGEETNIIIMSDHGMGPVYNRFRLNNWLVKRGYLSLVDRSAPLLTRLGLTRERTKHLLSLLPRGEMIRRQIPRDIKNQVGNENPTVSRLNVDWEKTTAFGLGEVGQIYINSDTNYNEIQESLISDLEEFADSKSIDITIHTKDEIYDGPDRNLRRAPDVNFMLQEFDFGISHGYSGTESIWTHDEHSLIGGAHRPDGVFIASGPSFTSGQHDASLLDIAPTVIHTLGEPIPNQVDGDVLQDILIENTAPEFASIDHHSWTTTKQVENDEETRREQLRSLGYLE